MGIKVLGLHLEAHAGRHFDTALSSNLLLNCVIISLYLFVSSAHSIHFRHGPNKRAFVIRRRTCCRMWHSVNRKVCHQSYPSAMAFWSFFWGGEATNLFHRLFLFFRLDSSKVPSHKNSQLKSPGIHLPNTPQLPCVGHILSRPSAPSTHLVWCSGFRVEG